MAPAHTPHLPPRARRGRRRGRRGPPFLSGCSSPRGPGCSPLHARAVFPGLPGCARALQCWLRRLPLLVGRVVDGDATAAGEQVIHPIGAGFILSFPTARVVLVLLGRGRRRRVGAARQVRGLVVPVHTVHFVLVEVKKLPGSGPAAQQPGRSHRRRPGAAGGRGGAAASAAAARSRGGEAGALGAGLHRRAGGRGRHGRRLLQPPPSLAAVDRRGAAVAAAGGNQSGQQGRRGRRRRRRRGGGAAGAAAGRPEPQAAVAAGRGGGGVQSRGVQAEVVREAGAAPAPHALRGLPDLHPQRIRGAFLLGLDPGHAGIHPRPPASDPHGPARAPRRRPLPRLSAPGPAAALRRGPAAAACAAGTRAGGRPEKGGAAEPGEASAAREERRRRELYPARRCPQRLPLAVPMWRPPRQGQNEHCACPADFKPSLETAALATAHARWPPREGAGPGPPRAVGRRAGRGAKGVGRAFPAPARASSRACAPGIWGGGTPASLGSSSGGRRGLGGRRACAERPGRPPALSPGGPACRPAAAASWALLAGACVRPRPEQQPAAARRPSIPKHRVVVFSVPGLVPSERRSPVPAEIKG